ncbi:mannose-1-phosphate guanylyltransferase [Pseudoalteromonas citrea]|uniref:Mannose-1-phosphate guanylyltransferase n=1 Tax=Pseudoalteromonas citrea TaxID=43655 RepID=A0A5S3XTT5_9GAMM|nr:nucleotidyltransferase family protein [Pseudoalteromonas citrea]TMP43499.1 mannose-1-phosphate guanylyltransferase [Pseudoalteromonas citrea]TMP62102.1 mannose-1-phosphate guanylyltransferase [Pseudoalteromonas citrea]
MKAILLAAGLGTRLRPITNTIPKCLVPIDGKPLLEIWLEKLVALGIEEILVNTHYFSEKVDEFIAHSPYKRLVTLVYEEKLLGTAGTLVRNNTFWKGHTTLVIHADNYCQSSLAGFINSHKKISDDLDASLLLFKSETPKSCGIVQLDENDKVIEFHEKVPNPPGNLASGALFIFTPKVYGKYFIHLEQNRHYELSIDIIPSMVGKMKGWLVDGLYVDVGTPENYNKVKAIQL